MPVARVIVAPAAEPVTLQEAKAQLRLEVNNDDTFVTGLIVAARQHIEKMCWRALVVQKMELVLPGFYDPESTGVPPWAMALMRTQEPIELPGGELTPVAELPTENPALTSPITSIVYIDDAGANQNLAAAAYEVDATRAPGRIFPDYGTSWPSTRATWNAVTFQYYVGRSVANVQQPLKQAVLLLVSQMYEHRTPEVTGTIVAKVEMSLEALLRPWRLSRVFR